MFPGFLIRTVNKTMLTNISPTDLGISLENCFITAAWRRKSALQKALKRLWMKSGQFFRFGPVADCSPKRRQLVHRLIDSAKRPSSAFDAESSEPAQSRAVAWFVKFRFSSWEQIWEHFSELSSDFALNRPYIEMRVRVQTDSGSRLYQPMIRAASASANASAGSLSASTVMPFRVGT